MQEHADRQPDAIALLAPGYRSVSYGQLWQRIRRTAARLNQAGIAEGDRVATVLGNGPEMAATFLGISAAGAACAPLNARYRAPEFEDLFADLRPKALIVARGIPSPAQDVANRLGIHVLEAAPPEEAVADVWPRSTSDDAVALVLHTSGTTSRPKRVELTHANLCYSARHIAHALELGTADRCLNVMPLFHVHGLIGAFLSSIAAGGSVVCAPDFLAPSFFDWIDEFTPTWYTAAPTIHDAIVARAGAHKAVVARSRLRFVRSSSAPLAPRLMADLERTFNVPVIEAYGMTEASHQIASNPLPPRTRKPGSVGVAIDTEIAVRGESGEAVGPGREGAIAIRGPNVAHSGWFDTGDRGWVDDEGYVFLTGRGKEAINRGGEKVSPREVDEVLTQHPAVAAAVTFAVPDRRLGEDVAAAVVVHGHASVSALALREFASTRLADFKVPRQIVFLDDIPTGPTGKPQRIGLAERLGLEAARDPDDVSQRPSSTAARNAGEKLLCDLWSEILDVGAVGVHDNFFELGGDSILAAQILSRLRELTSAEISMARFLDAPTVAQMAAFLSPGAVTAAARVDRLRSSQPRPAPLPLAFTQQGIWILNTLDPQSSAHVVSISLQLDGPLDSVALERALNDIVKRHEILRTTFPVADGVPVQRIAPTLDVAIEMAGSRTRDDGTPFDLTHGPLVRARVIVVGPDTHQLDIDLHHIVADARSRQILANELIAGYDALVSGRELVMDALPTQFADFAAWERRSLIRENLEPSLSYWKGALAGAPERLTLPVAPGASGALERRPRVESMFFSAEFVERLRAFSRSRQVSVFMTLTTAFELLLSRLADEDDIAVGVSVSGRTRPEFERLIGCFVNAVVLRTNVSGNPTFGELLNRVREASLHAYAHQDVPLALLVDALGAAKSPEHTPLFNVLLDFVDDVSEPATGGGVIFTPLNVVERMPAVDVLLYIKQYDRGFSVRLHYRDTALAPEIAVDILPRFQRLLEQALTTPDAPIASFSTAATLSAAERDKLLVEWNDTARDYPPLAVHQLFEQQVARTPDAVAVSCEGQHLTYRDLNRRANGIAARLRTLGVGPDTLVAICVERSLDTMVGLMGILKAGGSYLPLDPSYPLARLALMFDDAKPAVVVTHERLRGRLPRSHVPVVCLDALDATAAPRDENPDVAVSLEHLAYVIYTSGSTGQPKGAMNAHRAVANRLLWGQDTFQLDASDAVLQKTPLSFDVSVCELFAPLIAGARLVFARPDGHTDNAYLVRLIRSERITTIHFVPPMLDLFLDEPEAPSCESLRRVITSGEALRPDVQAKFFARMSAELFNLYGPTETAVEMTAWHCDRRADPATVPIGRPIANATTYILDRQGHPVAVGVPGELHIGGIAVGRGYWNQPALTAAAFVPDPFAGTPDARMYRSGDLARYRPDGNIEFLGRIDHQIKIRGVRIEPAEIEAALLEHAGIERCLVTVSAARGHDGALTAYVVPRDGAALTAAELRAFLRARLPQELVPAGFVVLDALPLTVNGKVDRRALPAPEPFRDPRGFVGPRDPIERDLLALWEALLGVTSISVTDNFFDLGGHSLAAIRLFDRITQRLGVALPPSTLFQAPTVEQLAEAIRTRETTAGGVLVAIQPHGTKPPLFCIHGLGGSVVGFHDLSACLGEDQPVYGLQAVGMDGRDAPHTRVEDMASHYLGEIRRLQPHGPYRLAGWSLGGCIAVEIARLLRGGGEEVGMLAFFDAPVLGIPTRLFPVEAASYRLRNAARTAQMHRRHMRAKAWRNRPGYVIDALKERIDTQPSDVTAAQRLALRQYRPAPFEGSAVLFRTRSSVETSWRGRVFGWEHVISGPIDVHDVPGEHLTLLRRPHVEVLADRLKEYL